MKRAEISPLKKHIEESPKLRELRHRRYSKRRRLVVLLGLLFLVMVAGFIYFARYPKFQLTKVVVSGNKIIDSEEVVNFTDTILDGDYLYIVPRRNAFLYPKNIIVKSLALKFPRFRNISVYRTSYNTLLVTVTEVRGRALWCGTNIAGLDTNSPCYFTDETGKIVSSAPNYSGNVYPRFFGGAILDNNINPVGKTFVSTEQFQNLINFADQITALGLPVKAISVGTQNDDSLTIDLGSGKTALIRFLADAKYSILAGNLSAALGKDVLKSALEKDKSNLQYFDLRFTNKVYYKFAEHS